MFLFKVPTFACGSLCNSWSVYRGPGLANVTGWTELGCTGPSSPFAHPPKLPVHLPRSIYLPLSHRLCGSPACCLVTGWSELDIIMTAMLIRPDPVFHLCLDPAQSEWLFEVRPGLSDEVNELRPNKQKTRSLHILIKFVWRSKMHKLDVLKFSHIIQRMNAFIIRNYLNVTSVPNVIRLH